MKIGKILNIVLIFSFIMTIICIVYFYPLLTNKIGQINVEKNSDFPICKGRIYEYYSVNTSYKGGRKEIRNQVFGKLENCIKQFDFKFSGIINIRFIVNCKGMAGYYVIKTVNNKYSYIELPIELEKEIIEIVKQLQDWNSGVNSRNKLVNSYYHINLKIENTQLINIF